ncbi:putative Mini-chromosome maintenance complex-binding protein [Blattamonas nauphoetae]|uniref:Mini-chromosome maintenance complex-binding protein n=1 Tax=Blattamonas nauphoetae TaxID=2049346 RepID=A0ABQ9Y129_9EUKA|nr:putative Mini-chromosome maintenance complex-binding protein [Blattamonas nauphoetae]
MIQDIHNTNVVVDKLITTNKETGQQKIKSGRFQELVFTSPQTQEEETITKEYSSVSTFTCVPVPGESSWVFESLEQDSENSQTFPCPNTPSYSSSLTDILNPPGLEKFNTLIKPHIPNSHLLSIPKTAELFSVCLLRIYGKEAESLRINDIVEVVGVFTTQSFVQESDNFNDPMQDWENVFGMSTQPTTTSSDGKRIITLDTSLPTVTRNPKTTNTDDTREPSSPNSHHPDEDGTLVPRVHAMKVTLCSSHPSFSASFDPLRKFNTNPATHGHFESDTLFDLHATPPPSPLLETARHTVAQARPVLLQLLTQCCCGDRLAAEYVLMFLFSRSVHIKEENPIGFISLHLSLPPPALPRSAQIVAALNSLLLHLLPTSHVQQITSSFLNSTPFVPSLSPDTSRLTPGFLQVPSGISLLFDETLLETPTQLSPLAQNNIDAVVELAHSQVVNYTIPFGTTPFHADTRLMFVSAGASLFNCASFSVPLVPTDNEQNSTTMSPNPDKSDQHGDISPAFLFTPPPPLTAPFFFASTRHALELVRLGDCDIHPALPDVLTDDYVKLRAQDSRLGARELQNLMNLARLNALSHGHPCVSVECWKEVLRLDAERRQRIDSSHSQQ